MSFKDIFNSLLSVSNTWLLLLSAWNLLQSRRVRQYPLAFCFFLFSAVFGLLLTFNYLPGLMSRAQFIKLYWAVELIEQGFALSMMVVIMRLALAGERSSAILGQGLASVAVVLVSVLLTDGEIAFASRWMTGFTRNLSFGVALMNFQIWGLLVAKRVKDPEVLLLASGLGLLTTGKSLGHTIRIVASRGSWAISVGDYVVAITAILATGAWWYAFRPAGKSSPRGKEKSPMLVKAA